MEPRKSRYVQFLRWLLLVPSTALAWYGALFAGLFALSVLENLCPPEHMISGACIAPWWGNLETVVMGFFSGVSALLVVIVPSALAPVGKELVAVAALISGAAVATWLVVEATVNPPPAYFVAVMVGAGTCYFRYSSLKKRGI